MLKYCIGVPSHQGIDSKSGGIMMKGLGFTNGGGDKCCCWFVGTTVSWSLYMEVDYVDVKVQWRDSNETSFYIRCLCFMFATFFVFGLLTIHAVGE